MHYRQGDVLFEKIPSLPPGKKIVRNNGHIVEGEATGHVHRVAILNDAEVIEIENGVFLRAGTNGVSIVHEDHRTLVLPSGNYKITRQREYSPEEIRNVAD